LFEGTSRTVNPFLFLFISIEFIKSSVIDIKMDNFFFLLFILENKLFFL
jgi:hypothetical protein